MAANHGPRRGRVWLVLPLVIGCVLAGVLGWVAFGSARDTSSAQQIARDAIAKGIAQPAAVAPAMERRVAAFCGDCHRLPDPANYSQVAWRSEVLRGYEFYARSGRIDLDPPPIEDAVAYFQTRAPETVKLQGVPASASPLGASFKTETFPAAASVHFPPAVSHLRWCRLRPNDPPRLVVCDMRQGIVASVGLSTGDSDPQLIARLQHPCHAEPCDLDGNGQIDLVVADMGGLAGVDFDLGRVIWLEPDASGGYRQHVLADGLGRVSDVRPADFNGDGKLDLLVGEFGARTGGIWILWNESAAGETPSFRTERVDSRPGTVHLLVHDLNGDQRMDFVALVSQEFEAVDAFVNRDNGVFARRPLWESGDPAFGSSGAELADLDGDGDMDVLFTNGDSFDDKFVKPCHGVQWLENHGDLRFEYHRLAELPGAYRAISGDVDGDGDLDVIASVWVEPRVQFGNPQLTQWPAVICLEQLAPGEFRRHDLAVDNPWHATIEAADFDADGDLDLAFGTHSRGPTLQLPYWLTVWWNQP